MTTLLSKRALSAGLGIGGLALFAQRASADTPLTSFAFPVTGGTTARTLPDRLAEVKNVKDFGALGNGQNDDRAAIQAAIDWNTGVDRGIVFFPTGNYKINGTLYLDGTPRGVAHAHNKIQLIGAGENGSNESGTRIFGDFNGALVEASAQSNSGTGIIIDGIYFQNGHATGTCIYLEMRNHTMISNCAFKGHRGVIFEQCNCPNQVVNCWFRTNNRYETGSIGVYLGGTGSYAIGCDFVGWDQGVRMNLGGNAVYSCRLELNQHGVLVGQNQQGASWQSSGFIVEGCTFESNRNAIRVFNGGGGLIAGNMIAANLPPNDPDGECIRGLYLHGASYTSVIGTTVTGQYSTAAIDMTNTNGHLSFISTNVNQTGTGVPLITVPGQYTAIACNFT